MQSTRMVEYMKSRIFYLLIPALLILVIPDFNIAGAQTVTPPVKKTLTAGETWDIGDGYSLTAESIDARSSLRSVTFSFYKDGVLLDKKMLYSGQTFGWKNIFSAKVDAIFAGAITDMVQFTDTSLRTEQIKATSSSTLTVGESWDIGHGFVLTAQAIDAKASPRQVWLVLSRDGSKVDDKVAYEGQVYSWNNIFSTKISRIYPGTYSDMVSFTDTYLNIQATATPAWTPLPPTSTPYYTPVSTMREVEVTYRQTEDKPLQQEVIGDFSVSISPTSVTVKPGETLRFTLTVIPSGGFSEPVDIYLRINALGQEKDMGRVKTFYPPYEPYEFESPLPSEIPQGTTLTGYITARGGGKEYDAGTVTVKVPGFEILQMISAVGIAIFLIRRKK